MSSVRAGHRFLGLTVVFPATDRERRRDPAFGAPHPSTMAVVSICRLFAAEELPDRRTVERSYSHNLVELVKVAGLQDELYHQEASDPMFQVNWTIVKDWTVASRYGFWSQDQAQELLDAVTDPEHGVLTWLRLHW